MKKIDSKVQEPIRVLRRFVVTMTMKREPERPNLWWPRRDSRARLQASEYRIITLS